MLDELRILYFLARRRQKLLVDAKSFLLRCFIATVACKRKRWQARQIEKLHAHAFTQRSVLLWNPENMIQFFKVLGDYSIT